MRTVLGLILCAGTTIAQNPTEPHAARLNPFADDSQAVIAGEDMFRAQCLPCHGGGGGRATAPDLSRGVYSVGERDEDLYRVIFGGGRVMPAFGSSFGDEGIWKLVSYVRHLSKPAAEKPMGDPVAGSDLFWTKGNCGACHRIGPRGASIGPDLTRIGSRHSVQYLRTALTDPDADLANGFATITVITSKGEKLQGVQRGYDFFSAQFIDSEGGFHSFYKDEVKELKRTEKSLMPGYSNTLRAAEIDDIVAFLYGLGR